MNSHNVGIIGLMIILFLAGNVSAGIAPAEEWNRTFSTVSISSDFHVFYMYPLVNGYLFGGYKGNTYNGSILFKTDEFGNWSLDKQGLIANESEYVSSFRITSDGGLVLLTSNKTLIKKDVNGTEEWRKTFGEDVGKGVSMIYQSSDNGYLFFIDGYLLIKTNLEGKEQWNRTFNISDDEMMSYIEQTSDGGYILSGYSFTNLSEDFFLIKADANGNEMWRKSYMNVNNISATSVTIQQTSDNGYFLAGYYPEIVIIKTYENGTVQWRKDYGNCSQDCFDGFIHTFYISPTTTDINNEGYIFSRLDTITKLDKNGNQQWNITIVNHTLPLIEPTFDEGYTFFNISNSNSDRMLVKIDKNGNQEWNKILPGYSTPSTKFDVFAWQTSDRGYMLSGSNQSSIWLTKLAGTVIPTPTPTATPTTTATPAPTVTATSTPTVTVTPTPTPTPISGTKGDVSGDGQVSVVDALFIAQYTVGTRTLTSTQLAAADVNGDGQVTIVDALFIAQYTVGLRQL